MTPLLQKAIQLLKLSTGAGGEPAPRGDSYPGAVHILKRLRQRLDDPKDSRVADGKHAFASRSRSKRVFTVRHALIISEQPLDPSQLRTPPRAWGDCCDCNEAGARKGGGLGRPLERKISVALILVVVLRLDPHHRPADLPDHAGPGNLNERTIGRHYELGRRVGLPEVPHCTVVDEIGAPIRTEPQIRVTIDPAQAVRERLLERGVMRKQAGLELEGLIRLAEVHEKDVVAGSRTAILGRKPKISFPADQRRSGLDDAHGKRLRCEVNSDERDVGWFDG